MADSTGRRPVVVGIDRSGHSEKALDWAVSEASARSLPLHLVHALETTVTVWSPMMAVPQDLDDHSWVLDAARRRVGETAPDLDVTSALTAGPAAAALVTASRDADTVVVGAGGHGVVGNILLGSTSLKVAGTRELPGGGRPGLRTSATARPAPSLSGSTDRTSRWMPWGMPSPQPRSAACRSTW